MKITEVRAIPLSFEFQGVTLGTGTVRKRDVVVVKITSEDGIVGYGEAHHALAHLAVAQLVTDSLAPLVIGQDALAGSKNRQTLPRWTTWLAENACNPARPLATVQFPPSPASQGKSGRSGLGRG